MSGRWGWAGLWLLTGCVSVVTSAAGPTALERQLLGAYDELDRDLVLAASVRGGAALTPGSPEALHAAAVEGRALMRFDEDDVLELKQLGCLGESLEALLVAQPCAQQGAQEKRLARVIRDENQAREAVLAWAAHLLARELGRDAPTMAELAEMRAAYRRLLLETAAPGQLFEVTPNRYQPLPAKP
ncbi:MAG: hypothetical protein U1E65_05070 [Myxococcota bacterium]